MPWVRKGKTVYNQETGKSKGTSATVEMAKRHMRALYANMSASDRKKMGKHHHHEPPMSPYSGDETYGPDDYS